MTQNINIEWEEAASNKYKEMLGKIPIFHRELTKQVVDQQAPVNAKERNSQKVEEEDIVKAFLSEVPKAFYSLMIRLMDDVEFNYKSFI